LRTKLQETNQFPLFDSLLALSLKLYFHLKRVCMKRLGGLEEEKNCLFLKNYSGLNPGPEIRFALVFHNHNKKEHACATKPTKILSVTFGDYLKITVITLDY
jgi:hypothetical protein